MQRQLFKSLLRVKLSSGAEIGILFKHRIFDKPTFDSMTCKYPMRGITYCEIYKILGEGDATIKAVGRGICKMPDRFDKKIGRKRALTSVLARHMADKSRIFSREDRELIWTAYWDSIRPATTMHPYGPVPLESGQLLTQDGTIIEAE